MPGEPITIATPDGRVTLTGVAYTERDHDDTLHVYSSDDIEIGEFPAARWTAHADHLE